jgi:hypothetical protein
MIIRSSYFRLVLPRAAMGCQWRGRGLMVGLVVACLLGVTAGSAAGIGIRARMQATQQLAVLLTVHDAYRHAGARSPRVALVAALRPITGERTTLPVIGYSTGPGGVRWLEVMLPGRPDGLTGWIAAQGTRRRVTGWHIVVDLARRSVSVYRDGRIARTFQAVVGKPSTPTPTGRSSLRRQCRWLPAKQGARSRWLSALVRTFCRNSKVVLVRSLCMDVTIWEEHWAVLPRTVASVCPPRASIGWPLVLVQGHLQRFTRDRSAQRSSS